MKINTDGTVNIDAWKGDGGGVARSHLSFLVDWSTLFIRVTDPLIVGIPALRDGVIFAYHRGLKTLHHHDLRSIVGPTLDKIGEISPSFISFLINHVVLDTNGSVDLYGMLVSLWFETDGFMRVRRFW